MLPSRLVRILLGMAMALGVVPPAVAAPARADARLHVQYVKAAGTTVAYAELGSGSPLLMLNGTGSPMNEWDPALLSALQTSHRLIVFDYPGLGLSGPAPGRWQFSRAADWVAQLIDALRPGSPIDVLGWSMGGFIAQQLVVRHSEQLRSVVLAATNPGGSRASLGPLWAQRLDSKAVESDRDYLTTNYPHTSVAQAAGRGFLRRLERAVDSGAYPSESVPTATYDSMVDAEDDWLRSDDNLRDLRRTRIRTLVITGADDLITPPTNSRAIAEAIAGSQLRLVPGAGHSFMFQQPDLAARTVHAFLAAG